MCVERGSSTSSIVIRFAIVVRHCFITGPSLHGQAGTPEGVWLFAAQRWRRARDLVEASAPGISTSGGAWCCFYGQDE